MFNMLYYLMNSKFYSLKLHFHKIRFSPLDPHRFYKIKVARDQSVLWIQAQQLSNISKHEISIHKKLYLDIPMAQLKKHTKCTISIIQYSTPQNEKTIAELSFLIMNYSNYSKKCFNLESPIDKNAVLQMTVSISNEKKRTPQIKRHRDHKNVQKNRKRSLSIESKEYQVRLQKYQINIYKEDSNESIQPVTNQIFAVQNTNIQPSLSKNQNKKIVKFQQSKKKQKLSSMGKIIQDKQKQNNQNQLKQSQINILISKSQLYQSNKQFSPRRSKYCEEIRHNMDNFNNLHDGNANANQQQLSRMNIEDNQITINDNFSRVMKKFEMMQQQEECLNDYTIQNQEHDEPEQTSKQISHHISDFFNPTYKKGFYKNRDSCFQKREGVLQMAPTLNVMIKQGQFQEQLSYNQKKINQRYKLSRFQHSTLVKSSLNQSTLKNEAQPQTHFSNQFFKIFDKNSAEIHNQIFAKITNKSLQEKTMIKFRRANENLIKANQELMNNIKNLTHKLQLSKRIIQQKQDIVKVQFQNLMNQLKKINDLLNMKTQESVKREEKIDKMQKQIEVYAREINLLKEDIKVKQNLIKDLKYNLFIKEESNEVGYESKSMKSKQGKDPINKIKNNCSSLNSKQSSRQVSPHLKLQINKEKSVSFENLFLNMDEKEQNIQPNKIYRKFRFNNEQKESKVAKQTNKSVEMGELFAKMSNFFSFPLNQPAKNK